MTEKTWTKDNIGELLGGGEVSKPTWQNAECADGKVLAQWLTDMGEKKLTQRKLTDAQKKHWRDWESGRHDVAEFNTVDHIVIRLGLHPQDVPDRAWIVRPEQKPKLSEDDVTEKKCEHCNEEISRIAPNGKRITIREYQRRKFCSDKCVRNSSKLKPRVCQAKDCNNIITKNLYRDPRYCCKKCQWKNCGRAPGSKRFQKQVKGQAPGPGGAMDENGTYEPRAA